MFTNIRRGATASCRVKVALQVFKSQPRKGSDVSGYKRRKDDRRSHEHEREASQRLKVSSKCITQTLILYTMDH